MTTTTFPLTGPINLNARLGHGSLVVTTRDDLAEATVAVTSRVGRGEIADRITVEMNGPTLTVRGPRQGGVPDLISAWRHDREAVDVEITVPTATAMKIATFTADVTVVGRCGGADVATGVASISMDEVDGDLRLRYGTATSTVRSVRGSVVVRSGSGDAHFGAIDGDVHAGLGSGQLQIGVAGGAVRFRAGSGGASLASVQGDVDVAAGSGDVSVGLPAGVSARLDVRTGSGRVSSELPIEDDRTGTGRAITIRVRTGSGHVQLFRAPQSTSGPAAESAA